MNRRSMLWQVAAALFTAVNLVGAGYALALNEVPHASTHGVLALVGAYMMWWLAARAQRQNMPTAQLPDARLEQLQQSVDAIALEVERISESQRFAVKLKADRSEPTS